MYHYVYKITNEVDGKFYIGVRSCKSLPEKDLGIQYLSSSTDNDFIEEQKKHPEHFLYEVIEVFNTRKDAAEKEYNLLKEYDVFRNDKMYNKGIVGCFDSTDTTIYYDPDTFREYRFKPVDTVPPNLIKGRSPSFSGKISKHTKGRKHSKESKRKMSESRKGISFSEPHKENLKKSRQNQTPPMTGKTHSPNTKQKMSNWQKGKPKKKVECPYGCGTKMSPTNMKRWHLDKCHLSPKNYKNESIDPFTVSPSN